jgi:hypothetical protein
MGVLAQLSACSCSSLQCCFINNVTIHNEGVYIWFSSCTLKLSNLHIQFYLLALTPINAFYLLRMRAITQGLFRLHKCASLNCHIYVCASNPREIQKFVLALVQLSFASTLACLMLAMLLHHTPSLENFHGILSMSSRTVCPCF